MALSISSSVEVAPSGIVGALLGSWQFDTPGTSVNKTYIPFGARGEWGASNQVVQDRNAARSNSSTVAARTEVSGLVV